MNYPIDKRFLPFQMTMVQICWKKLTFLKSHLDYLFVYLCECVWGGVVPMNARRGHQIPFVLQLHAAVSSATWIPGIEL